jgi:hypothetical protein
MLKIIIKQLTALVMLRLQSPRFPENAIIWELPGVERYRAVEAHSLCKRPSPKRCGCL